MPKKLIVIGGGAAGFFCAIHAAKQNPHLEVVIVEKSSRLLNKVRISGGGRCNVTHACFSIREMVQNYPRGGKLLKNAFKQFFTTDTIAWFQQRGVQLKTEADGRMFPQTDSSETIIQCLLKEAGYLGVKIAIRQEVIRIEPQLQSENSSQFKLFTRDGGEFNSNFVCIACGGFPKSNQYQWLTDLGHQVEEPVPSLFTFNIPGNPVTALMGISVNDVQIKINGRKFSQCGPLLITHWGLSGPAVLKLSAFAALDLAKVNYHFTVTVNWVPEYNENTLAEELKKLRFELASKKMANRNPFKLPQRLWEYFLHQAGIDPETRWADLPAKKQNLLTKTLSGHQFQVKGKTTFKEEFVTAGGVKLSEVDTKTMESNIISGLFFAGEILDVDGITGGFNFQNAWTTGYIAGNEIGAR